MKIEFYEEFPSKENLDKLKQIKFKTRLFVAAKSLEEFRNFEKQIIKINKKIEVAYWPIVKNSYWISPFSNRKDLIELFRELEKIKNHLLIDLELPLAKRFGIIIKNIPRFSKNKKIIKAFLEKNKNRITTAQYPSSFISKIMKILGLGYEVRTEKSLMLYTSMISRRHEKWLKKNISKIKDKNNYSISLGTIAIGILGNEPILPPENLKKDLEFVKNQKFGKAIIFRLGGLDKEYMTIIEKFVRG